MEKTKSKLSLWMDAVVMGASESSTMLADHSFYPEGDGHIDQEAEIMGAYIPLVSQENNLQIGMLAGPDACETLTRAMLGEDLEGEPDLTLIADSLGEIMNVIAGVVKTNMAPHDPELKIGLPLFVSGRNHDNGRAETLERQVNFGDVPARLVVLRKEPNDAGASHFHVKIGA